MTSNETTITVALASDSPITIDAAYDAIDRAYPDAEIDVTRASVDATQIDVVTEDMMRDSEIANRVRGILDELWMAAEETTTKTTGVLQGHDFRTTGFQFSSRTEVGSCYEMRCTKCGKGGYVGTGAHDGRIALAVALGPCKD